MDANDIIMSLPPFVRAFLKAPDEVKAPDLHPTGNGGRLALLAAEEEVEETPVVETPEEENERIVGALSPAFSNVQIWYERYKVTGSIQVPGMGTFFMRFSNILPAEEAIYKKRQDADDARFCRYLYREYIEPTRPFTVDGDRTSHACRFAASPIYNDGRFEDVYSARSFALAIWQNDVMTNLWLIDGTRLFDVVLKANPGAHKNPKAPKWEGTVR